MSRLLNTVLPGTSAWRRGRCRADKEGIEAVIRAAWALDTCDPVDAHDWSPANPSRGQCGSTALIIHDLLGGHLLMAEVIRSDGSRQGVHYWNLLPDGTELDLTRDQFADDEVIKQPSILQRPAGLPNRCAEQYLRMRHRVFEALGIADDDDTSAFNRTDMPPLDCRKAADG